MIKKKVTLMKRWMNTFTVPLNTANFTFASRPCARFDWVSCFKTSKCFPLKQIHYSYCAYCMHAIYCCTTLRCMHSLCQLANIYAFSKHFQNWWLSGPGDYTWTLLHLLKCMVIRLHLINLIEVYSMSLYQNSIIYNIIHQIRLQISSNWTTQC